MSNILQLDKLIEAVLNDRLIKEEEAPVKSGEEAESRVLRLPRYRVSETWGNPSSEDRAVISKFMSHIEGSDLQGKFTSLNNFITKCKKECVREKDTPKIIANLIVLNSLASMITDFNKQTAGFLMEAFLAALLGGDAAQISIKSAGQKDIEIDIADITNLEGLPTSVKFLSKGSKITGSKRLLDKYFGDDPTRSLRYLLIQKQKDDDGEVMGLAIYEFFVTGTDEHARTNTLNYNKYLDDKGRLNISQEFVQSDEPYAVLKEIRKNEILELTNSYIELLQANVTDIFDALDRLNTGIEDYLITNEPGRGQEAQRSARTLITTVDKSIKNKNT